MRSIDLLFQCSHNGVTYFYGFSVPEWISKIYINEVLLQRYHNKAKIPIRVKQIPQLALVGLWGRTIRVDAPKTTSMTRGLIVHK